MSSRAKQEQAQHLLELSDTVIDRAARRARTALSTKTVFDADTRTAVLAEQDRRRTIRRDGGL